MPQKENIYDLIIIGGGPAALSAGIYVARKKIKSLLIAKSLGGQPTEAWQIDNYLGFPKILGTELAQKFADHLKKFKDDIDIRENEIVVIIKKIESFGSPTSGRPEVGLPKMKFEVTTDKNKYQVKSVLIASGVMPRKLGIPGEEQFLGKGVVFCATCDAPLFKDKAVAVVGSGNSGLDSAIQLTKYAKKIYLLNKYADFKKADPAYIEQVKASSIIEVLYEAKAKEIKGDKFVRALAWEGADKKEQEIQVDGVFVEIGASPNLHFIKDLIEYNQKGEIIVDPKTSMTSCPGIFAAGDVTDTPYKQIIIAAGDGAKAALNAYYYLTGSKSALRSYQ